MKKSHERKNSYKLYEKCNKVFVKCKRRRGRKSARHMILVGSILKRYKDNTNYDIEMEGQRREITKRVRIENLADCPDKTQSKKSVHPLLIPITHDECLQSMTDQGYEVLYDPPGDGNCQFSSVAFALRDLHIFRSAETLRNEVVSYLNSHDYSSDGIPLELFAGIPWSQYLTEMARSETYGDEITLCTISNMFNVEIVVVSTF